MSEEISGLVVYGLGIPLWLGAVLFRSRQHLHDADHAEFELTRFRLGSFFKDYEPAYYFWEIVFMLVKAALVGMLGVVAQYSPVQLLVGSIICFGYTLVLLRVAPYQEDGHDVLSFVCMLALTVTYLGGLMKALDKKYEDLVNAEDRNPMLETAAFSTALVVINVIPLVCLVANLVYYTWASKKKPGLRAHNRPSASANDPSGSGQSTPAPAGSHQIVPMTAPEPEEDTHEQHVEAIHRAFSQHEAGLRQRQEKHQQRSKRNTQMRLLARMQVKQTRALHRVAAFSGLDDAQIGTIVDAMTYRKVQRGEVMCTEGEPSDALFVVVAGSCKVTVRKEDGGEDGEVRVGTISSLEHFGESAVQSLDDKNGRGAAPVREATVTAESAELQVLRLSREDFTRLHRSGVLDASVVAELQRVRTARQVENRRTLSLVSRSSTGGGGVDL